MTGRFFGKERRREGEKEKYGGGHREQRVDRLRAVGQGNKNIINFVKERGVIRGDINITQKQAPMEETTKHQDRENIGIQQQ